LFAIANFDKYQVFPVAHDEVDFPNSTVEIAFDQGESLALQVLGGLSLYCGATLSGVDQSPGPLSLQHLATVSRRLR
jgi:hypothetical protein